MSKYQDSVFMNDVAMCASTPYTVRCTYTYGTVYDLYSN